jgi:hypothetical protein
MTLRLEECIEVPERAFNEFSSGHLVETHFEQDLSEQSSNLQKWVQMTALWDLTLSIEIELFELGIFPITRAEHFDGEICLHLLSLGSKVSTLRNLVALVGDHIDKLTLLHLIDDLLVVRIEVRIFTILREKLLVFID